MVHERSRDRKPLLLAAGELVRKVVGHVPKAELCDQLLRPPRPTGRGSWKAGGEHDVVGSAELLDEVKRLEHEAHVTQPRAGQLSRTLCGQPLSREDDFAGVGPIEPTEQMQQRRLAAARAPQHSDDLVSLHCERHTIEHATAGPADPDRLFYPAGLENGHNVTVPT